MAYAFEDAKAKDRHLTNTFEIFCNRAIYHDGWLPAQSQGAVGSQDGAASFDQDHWNCTTSSMTSVSRPTWQRNTREAEELQALFLKEALKYSVLPLDDRSLERLNPKLAGRPDLMGGRTSLTVYEGMTE